MKKQNIWEKLFEDALWNARLGTILVVIFSALGALAMFVVGSWEICQAVLAVMVGGYGAHSTETLLIGVIGAVDLYLIGIVLIIFAFGIYELFVSRIDIANRNEDITILRINSIDELKNKILKVIIMVLIVSFFKSVLSTKFTQPNELLIYAVAILAVATSVFLIRRIDKED